MDVPHAVYSLAYGHRFQFLAVVDDAVVTRVCMFESLLSRPSGGDLRVELLDHMVTVCLTF